jgi:5-formyltetrahydrofolate cyclo-ligase
VAGRSGRIPQTIAWVVSAFSPKPKNELRQEIREALKKLSAAERAIGSEQICQRVRAQPVWKEACAVLLFVPSGFEPDIRPLLDDALRAGKGVALPRFSSEQNLYVTCRIEQEDCNLQPGPFGVAEPGPACPIFPANQLDFCLVHLSRVYAKRRTVGSGQGYYDRLLAEVRGFKCGVAFECQVVANIPLEPHDILLNCILTPMRWHLVATAPVLK